MLVREREQKKFSQLLKTLTNSLPDDDTEFSVFDYYVDESGEWDVWQSRCLTLVHVYKGIEFTAHFFPSAGYLKICLPK